VKRVVLLAVLAVLFAAPSPASAAVSIYQYEVDGTNGASPDYIGVVNDTGVFYIGLYCFRENYSSIPPIPATGGHRVNPGELMEDGRNDVGPGYVFAAAAILPNNQGWQTKTRDYIDVSLSDPRTGGWAKYGLHTARSSAPNMSEVQVGLCFNGGRDQQPDFGSGVTSSQVLYGPYINGAGQAEVGIRVNLARKEYSGAVSVGSVTYQWKIGSRTAELRTAVNPTCCSWYAKEPKFTVNDYFNDVPYNGLVLTCNLSDCGTGQPAFVCAKITGQKDPVHETIKCRNSYREQVWFKYNDSGNVGTDCPYRCTWVLARGSSNFDPNFSTYWANGWGLDAWAADAAGMARWPGAQPPSPAGYPSYCSGGTTFAALRSWEGGRWTPNGQAGVPDPRPSPDGSTTDQVGFHGWTGGTGLTDCQNLFRQVPGSVEYDNYFQFEFR
jgi:hypothetical protein